jgi:predicted ABC-type transport system involved in lysophospholipase L1 biosynthesis ATPase subunit
MDILLRLRGEHRVTLVMVTHDQELARHGTRIIRIKDGQIVAGN